MKKEYQEILDKFKNIYPVPVEEIAEALGYSITRFEPNNLITNSVSGTVNYKDKKILINGLEPDYRQRFTIAHEIAHILNGDDKDGEIEIDYRENINGSNKNIKEKLANQLAAEILMPEDEFIKKFDEIKATTKLETVVLVNLSYYFKVSQEGISIRIKKLNLTVWLQKEKNY